MSAFNANDYLDGMHDAEALKGDAETKATSDAGCASESSCQCQASQNEQSACPHEPCECEHCDCEPNEPSEQAERPAQTAVDGAAQAGQESAESKSDPAQETLTPLGQAKKEAAEYLEALQRERAEFINFRNRAAKEQDRFRQHGIIDVLTALLPALDDIDRIREHSEMDESFNAVSAKIDKTFEKFGVEKFGVKGEDFDPTKHDAILHRPDPEATKETVDAVVEAGYRIGDRVIRAARVVVASPNNA